jgi:predicted RecB family nuclease
LPKYSEVNWEDAECKRLEIYTDLFYDIEEERSVNAYDHINSVRRVCVSCPIWKECLTYAFENEQYGMWGGMTSQERASLDNPMKYPNQRLRGFWALRQMGITLDQILECKINVR